MGIILLLAAIDPVEPAIAVVRQFEKTAEGKTLFGLPFGWGAIFSLLTAIITTVFGSGALAVWLSKRHENRKVEQDGDAQIRSEMWRDIENLKISKDNTARRLTIAETKLAEQASELGQLRFLIALVNSELERVSPGNAIAKQVRVIMEDLQHRASSSLPEETGIMADIMSKMCKIPEEKGGV